MKTTKLGVTETGDVAIYVKPYIVATAQSIAGLESNVDTLIAQGYAPTGGFFGAVVSREMQGNNLVDKWNYYQAMVLKQ